MQIVEGYTIVSRAFFELPAEAKLAHAKNTGAKPGCGSGFTTLPAKEMFGAGACGFLHRVSPR
jgi:isopenicillin N synthase-like dioxygenase